MSHRNLLGPPDNPPRFPDVLVTELGANCADPWSGSWFGQPAHNFPSRRNSFTTDLNDVPTVAASDVTEFHDERHLTSSLSTQEREVIASPFSASVHQQAAASSSQQQPAAAASSSQQQPAAASILECHNSVAKVNCSELRETAAKW